VIALPFKQSPDIQIALFGAAVGVAVTFTKWLSMNRRTLRKLLVMLTSSAVWGAIIAWGIHGLNPDVSPEIAGVFIAVLSYGGTEATVSWLSSKLGITVEEKP
jgi:hypothetical protein